MCKIGDVSLYPLGLNSGLGFDYFVSRDIVSRHNRVRSVWQATIREFGNLITERDELPSSEDLSPDVKAATHLSEDSITKFNELKQSLILTPVATSHLPCI